MLVTLIRLAFVSSQGSINNEPSPPIGLAYISSICKVNNVDVKGIDATGYNVNKIFKIPETKLQGNGIDIDKILELIDPETKVWVSCQEESIEGLNTEQIIGIANECLRAHGLI